MYKTRNSGAAKFFRDVTIQQFRGGGLNDLTIGGTYTGRQTQQVLLKISTVGTPDKFKYSKDGGVTWSSEVSITAGPDAVVDGITATFGATTGHTLNDEWAILGECVAHSLIDTDSFVGSGLDDMTPSGTYKAHNYDTARVKISTAAATDKFQVSWDGGKTYSAEVAMTGGAQHIGYGALVTFLATTGHTVGDYWDIPCYPALEMLEIPDISVNVVSVEVGDELIFTDEDGNFEFAKIPLGVVGHFHISFENPPTLLPGKDVKVAAAVAQSVDTEVTITANVINL